MEKIMFYLTLIGTVATVISTFISIKAKNEAKDILGQIKQSGNKNAQNLGNIRINNAKDNKGNITGINTGSIHIGTEEDK